LVLGVFQSILNFKIKNIKIMHKGRIVAIKNKYKILDCVVCGFKHLYPIPYEKDLNDFYKEEYVKFIKKRKRAPDIKRILSGGKEKERELKWLTSTLYKDIDYILHNFVSGDSKKLCDIGCGTGIFLKYMSNKGWKTYGIEPSQESYKVPKRSGINVFCGTLEEFLAKNPSQKSNFDVVTMLNVLEHVRNPIETLKQAKELLRKFTGVIVIMVPNDFSKLQMYAAKKLNKDLWWVAIPDHVNYFDFKSLQKILVSLNFEILYYTTDFPMEIFLLFGEDYVNNSKVGSMCHKKRINFELSIPDELRREIYHKLAEVGVGRSILIFGKRKD
jgi:2-polyprenyl-3-methyl-5-hydroxy-6-metoxy-1,4-benzoquinol methylase